MAKTCTETDDCVTLRIMTFNLRVQLPEGESDPRDNWPNRRKKCAAVFEMFNPDLVGSQEPLQYQIEELQALLPSKYKHIAVGREADLSGENMVIFYNHEVLRPLDTGTLWLSDTPDVPGSSSWGNYWLRLMIWAKFFHVKSRKVLYHFNTHLDTVGERVRVREAQFITEKIAQIAGPHPSFLTADFNSAGGLTPTWKHFITSGFRDSWMEATTRRGKQATFTGFQMSDLDNPSRYDWILYTGNPKPKIQVVACVNFDEPIEGRLPSDHSPVVADLKFLEWKLKKEEEKKTEAPAQKT